LVLLQFHEFISHASPVPPAASEFGRDVPLMEDSSAFIVHRDKFSAPGIKFEGTALPLVLDEPYGLKREENYDSIDPIHCKDMFVVPDTFSDARENKSLWQRLKWRYAIKLELVKMD
jgi:hypothetical protein